MIIAIDTETQGLDATKYLTGCITHWNGKHEVYRNKEALYTRILELGKKCWMKKERLLVYGHNLQYDYVAIGAHLDERNEEYCPRPFLANFNENNRNPIKWIDNYGLWRGSLATLGNELGMPKGETPKWLYLDKYEPTEKEMLEAEEYMKRDSYIIIHYLKEIKKMLKEEGMRVNYLFTIPQIAYSYFIKKVRLFENLSNKRWDQMLKRRVTTGNWLADVERGEMRMIRHREIVHKALRGGRVECFKPGEYEKVHAADVNSLYPHIAQIMRFPDLKTEQQHITNEETIHKYLHNIGVSTVLIRAPLQLIGFLPVRVQTEGEEHTIYPSDGEYLYGSWTHAELERAVHLGYEIIHVEKTVTWEDGPNPLAKYMNELYEKKRGAEGFKKTFFKLMLNGLIGKFAQRRKSVVYELIDVEQLPAYQEKGWNCTALYGTNCRIEYESDYEYKRNYCPIITALVTAGAREHMYNLYQKVPDNAIIYSDTDSVYWNGLYSGTDIFKYTNDLGGLKLEHAAQTAKFYRRKAYRIGDTIRLNRIPTAQVTREAFEAGHIHYKEIVTLKENREHAGKQRQAEIQLKEEKPHEQKLLHVDTKETITEEAYTKLQCHLTKNSSDSSTSSQEQY